MVWPTLGSRTAKEQNRTYVSICSMRSSIGIAYLRRHHCSRRHINVKITDEMRAFVSHFIP